MSALFNNTTATITTLSNANGLQAKITNYGATLMSLSVPDRQGILRNIVLGSEDPSFYWSPPYLRENPYFGAMVGRNANVIKNAEFSIDDKIYRLEKNFANHNLHGGIFGFDKKIWNIEDTSTKPASSVTFSYLSPDGEEGFPGNLHVRVSYQLNDLNELTIHHEATTDRKTIVNITNHSYFNLAGEGNGIVTDHKLTIDADTYVEFDEELVPTGNICNVEGTPMDFRVPQIIGDRIDTDFDQLNYAQGYDLTYVLNNTSKPGCPAAILYHENSGRRLDVFTTTPGLHLYTGNSLTGESNPFYGKRCGVCLETQYFPDALRFPHFKGSILRTGDTMKHSTIFKFSIC